MLRVNSKLVQKGDTFLALKGIKRDGHNYIEDAINKGAVCVICEHGDYPVKTIITDDTRSYLGKYLKDLNEDKLSKIKIIGIVGSTGKTVTGDFIYQLLNILGHKTAVIGTNGFYAPDYYEALAESTPDIYKIYECINKAISLGCKSIVIEASSGAIIQRHLEGLMFDFVIFTNIVTNSTKDIDLYVNSKVSIFKNLKKTGYAIINKKDKYTEEFTLSSNNNIFYNDGDFKLSNIKLGYSSTEFNINDNHIYLPLIGIFNAHHYLASYIISRLLSFDDSEIIEATKKMVPADGRFQNINFGNKLIIIDYAHEVCVINNIIKETKDFALGKIITVIGCGGDRDNSKRPKIGKLVTEKCDYAIFTNDNPRNEDPLVILDEIKKGATSDNYTVIPNRKDAIKKGIGMLLDNDILLILGKGHENIQIADDVTYDFKDYDEVMKIIR